MRLQAVLLGFLFCLAAQAAGRPSPMPHKSAPEAQQTLTGCIDQQDGKYVLLDDQMLKIASLQSPGSDDDVFAKHVGHKVRVRGTRSSGQKQGAFKVTSIEQLSGSCGQAK